METRIDEIAPDIYRLSSYVEADGFGIQFNQFVIDADEPLLWHTGPRGMFPSISEALATVVPVDRLRWISFGHVENDECGALGEWLVAAPNATVVHGAVGVMLGVGDWAGGHDARRLEDGEILDLGDRRVRWIDTPHVPHGWDAGLLYEETTRTLLCGDLFTHFDDPEPVIDSDIVDRAIGAEDAAPGGTALTPLLAPTIRRLADLEPATLAVMHGSSTTRQCGDQLHGLADYYQQAFDRALT